MKLIIQIPCFNEEDSLPAALAALPREIEGVDEVEWLIVNDGSTDGTIAVARAHGVDHIVDLPINMGLSHGFMAGLVRGLSEGADIIVNTDADNQYDARDIPLLVAPILEGRAHLVVGDRRTATIAHFSPAKRLLQHLGSAVVRGVSRTDIRDAPSGFRAMSREAALRMNVFDSYTYTLESVIQAGLSNMRVLSVPIRVNGETRPSRLVRSIGNYVQRSIGSILRSLLVYAPARTFFLLGLPLAILGTLLALRWLWLFEMVDGGTRAHVPSLVAAAVLLIVAVLLWTAGLLGQLLAINRQLSQNIQYLLRQELLRRPGTHPTNQREAPPADGQS